MRGQRKRRALDITGREAIDLQVTAVSAPDPQQSGRKSTKAVTFCTAAITAEALTAASARAALAVGLEADTEMDTYKRQYISVQSLNMSNAGLALPLRKEARAKHSLTGSHRGDITGDANGAGPSVRKLPSRLPTHTGTR